MKKQISIKQSEPKNSVWRSLNPEQQDVLIALDESEDENNLISLAEIKLKYKDWPL